MPDTFLHGVETVQVAAASGTITTAKTAVIGLIGTAEVGTAQTLVLTTNAAQDIAAFGAHTGPDDTIAFSLQQIRLEHPNAVVFAVSVGNKASAPDATDFVGAVDALTGVKTGLKLFDNCRAIYGFTPKVFIAPGYSAVAGVIVALKAVALKFRGCCYLDSTAAMPYATALVARGVSGIWNSSDYRAKLIYGGIDFSGDAFPASASCAGLRSFVDNTEGFWYSSSNHNLKGIPALETPLQWELNDDTCEVNMLNAQGITTFVNVYGSGIREWGNRNSAFPTNTDARTFEAVQRLDDITSEAIEQAMLPYLDKPMTPAMIDLVCNTVNTYFNSLISRGALIQGSVCTFDAERNTTENMAAGKYVWTKTFMSAVPGERFTFYSVIDTSLLTNLLTA